MGSFGGKGQREETLGDSSSLGWKPCGSPWGLEDTLKDTSAPTQDSLSKCAL